MDIRIGLQAKGHAKEKSQIAQAIQREGERERERERSNTLITVPTLPVYLHG